MTMPRVKWWEGIPQIEELERRRTKLSTVLPQASWMAAPRGRAMEMWSRPSQATQQQYDQIERANIDYRQRMLSDLQTMQGLRGIRNPAYPDWLLSIQTQYPGQTPQDVNERISGEVQAEQRRTGQWAGIATAQALDEMYQPQYAEIIAQLEPYLDDPQIADAYQQLQQIAASPVTGELQQVEKLRQLRVMAGKARDAARSKVLFEEEQKLSEMFPDWWKKFKKAGYFGGGEDVEPGSREEMAGGFKQWIAKQPEWMNDMTRKSEGLQREFPELFEEFAKLGADIPFSVWVMGNRDVSKMIDEFREEQKRPRTARVPQWVVER